ncbi:hypothetical protein [Paraburkholderia tropica]|uniref:hypothetical protein n=1 Tax=Paraburkholderia tropica TaxID=92647 RepID=UPI003D28ECCE
MKKYLMTSVIAACAVLSASAHSESLNNADHIAIRNGLLKVTRPSSDLDDEIITLNGIQLKLSEGVKGNPNTTFSYHFTTADSDFVLLALSQNAEACPVQYSWMKIAKNSYGYTPVFGTCSDLAQVKVSGSKMIMTMRGYVPESTVNSGGMTQAEQSREEKKLHTYVFDTVTGKVTENGKELKDN